MGYVVDGKLYCQLADAWVPHVLPADPPSAAPIRAAATHDHMHGPSCGHEMVPHGDHVDYLVGKGSLSAGCIPHLASGVWVSQCAQQHQNKKGATAVKPASPDLQQSDNLQVGDELQHICSFAGGPCADAPCLGGASNAISSHGRIKVHLSVACGAAA